jgi:hypothetical protein
MMSQLNDRDLHKAEKKLPKSPQKATILGQMVDGSSKAMAGLQ